jgi:hypothetical protein
MMVTAHVLFRRTQTEGGRDGGENPLFTVMKLIVEKGVKGAQGSQLVELVDEHGVEADVALVDTLEDALHVLKETERTHVLLAFCGAILGMANRAEAQAFAARNSGRVTAGPIVDRDGEENYVFVVQRKITELAEKEKVG